MDGVGADREDWIAAASELASYPPGFLGTAWEDPETILFIPVEVETTVVSGPAPFMIDPRRPASFVAACGTRRTSWVEVNHNFKNTFGHVLFNLRMRKNFSYDGCRSWHVSTVTTPGTSTIGGLGGWSYEQITHSTDGYEYANGRSTGRTYSERTARWRGLFDATMSPWTRCHANWNGTHGCASGKA